ncbi:hypothetical protein PTKIN_Ptkin03bG0229600 [Pterospermum kingtungense]
MEETSTAISGPCVVRIGNLMSKDLRIAEKGFLGASSCREITAPLAPCEGNSGDSGAILSNKIETEDSFISREDNHQGSDEDDGSVSFGSYHENSCSQSVAGNIGSISFEEVSALEVNSERNSSITQVGETNNTDVAGDDGNRSNESDPKSSESFLEVPQQKKIRKAENQYLFELKNIPLWGFTSTCGRRPEMEDAVAVIPRFLQVPSQMMKVESMSNGMNYSLSNLTAHFYGVYDGHGGCQVANYCSERMHLALAEEIEISKACIRDGNNGHDWQEQWKKVFANCFIKVDAEIKGVHRGTGGNKTDHEPVAPETVGSTAVVAVVSSTHIIVANCGDSRAVLYRGKLPMPLSVDHKVRLHVLFRVPFPRD